MSEGPSLIRLLGDAVRRHRGLGSLLGRLIRVLLREGPRGLVSRLGIHSLRLADGGEDGLDSAAPATMADTPDREEAEQRGDRKNPSPPAPGLKPGLLLIGHPYAVSGRAEDIRTAARACDQAAVPFAIRNMLGAYGKEEAVRHRDFPFYDRVGTGTGFKANLFMVNADEMEVCYKYQGPEVFDGPYNIGCFAWELSGFPDDWVGTLDYFHEVWAPTRFIQQALADKTDLPVTLMPFAVAPGSTADRSRSDFGLPDGEFLFLFFFDFRSYRQRKNPWAVMESFARAFPPDAGARVHLVIKVNGTEHKQEEFADFLASPLARDPRVQIVDRVLDDRGINALVSLCDCFVSLHRSEGFGRGLAEAMYFGKPVIATAYSGNLDFMNPLNSCLVDCRLVPVAPGDYPHGEGQRWADADIEHAAWYMRKLYAEPAYAAEIGGLARNYMSRYHSFRAVGERYRRRLERLGLIDARN